MKVKSLSCVQLLETPWTAAYQAPLSKGFSRQEYWSGVPLPSPPLPTTQLKKENITSPFQGPGIPLQLYPSPSLPVNYWPQLCINQFLAFIYFTSSMCTSKTYIAYFFPFELFFLLVRFLPIVVYSYHSPFIFTVFHYMKFPQFIHPLLIAMWAISCL